MLLVYPLIHLLFLHHLLRQGFPNQSPVPCHPITEIQKETINMVPFVSYLVIGCPSYPYPHVNFIVSADSPVLQEALKKYHRELISDNIRISELLLAEHGIDMKYVQVSLIVLVSAYNFFCTRPRTIKLHRQQLGLTGSRKTMKMLDPKEAEQLVLDQIDRDAARHQGPRTIRHKLAMRTGQHLPRDYISDTMHIHDPTGFSKRNPTANRIHREPKVSLGINERWSADGHDKLNKIGFPVWAIVDDAVGKWLGIWVVPSNCLGNIIAYLFLDAVENVGGTILQPLHLHPLN